MSNSIAVVVGHPAKSSFCRALAAAYCEGAKDAGYAPVLMALSDMTFDPILHEGYRVDQPLEPDLVEAQKTIKAASHLVLIYPLWAGGMPALLKGFFERTFLPGFAYSESSGNMAGGLLKGRSVRLVITMGMPAIVYRTYFGAHSLKALKRGLLGLCGLGPIRTTLLGGVEAAGQAGRDKWLERMRRLGEHGR